MVSKTTFTSIGIDIDSISKMKEVIDGVDFSKSCGLLKNVFTEREIAYCTAKANPAQHFAVRFAGKEALLKALGTGLREDMLFANIEFLNDTNGKPYVCCTGSVKEELVQQKVGFINVSFSHSCDNAIAFVLLEKNNVD